MRENSCVKPLAWGSAPRCGSFLVFHSHSDCWSGYVDKNEPETIGAGKNGSYQRQCLFKSRSNYSTMQPQSLKDAGISTPKAAAADFEIMGACVS